MFVSRRLLCRNGLGLHVQSLDRRHDRRNRCKAFHPLELLLAVEQHRPQPAMEHRTPTWALDIPLTVPNQREQALDHVARQHLRAGHGGYLQPMHR